MLTRLFGGPMLIALALWPACNVCAQGRAAIADVPAHFDEPPYALSLDLQNRPDADWISDLPDENELFEPDDPALFGPRLSFDGIFGDRRGLSSNDYSVGAFLPWHPTPHQHVVFAVVRGTASDAGNFAGSIGIGQRFYSEQVNRIAGISAWCDVDDGHRQTYYRAGAQLEVIGGFLEFRGGADVIAGDKQWTPSGPPPTTTLFNENAIRIRSVSLTERAYDQAYVELGGPLPLIGRYGVSGYAGAYYLWHSTAEGVVGGQARAAAALTDNVQLGTRLTNDDLFGFNASAYVSLAIPTGGLQQIFLSPRRTVRGQSIDAASTGASSPAASVSVADRLANDVMRDFRLPVHFSRYVEDETVINPANGRPYAVVHVDPDAAAQGDGTFENPFNTLEAARLANNAALEIIRVQPHDDGSGTNLAVGGPFALFAGQRLLASSVTHRIATPGGWIPLPGFTGGPAPLITNSMPTAGTVVMMADDTEVSGFQIDGMGRHAGLQGNIDSFNINRNTIFNSTNGVQMANARGLGMIDVNLFRDNINDGVNVTVTNGGSFELVFTNNTADRNGGDGVDITATGSRLTATFEDNELGGSGNHGLSLTVRDAATVTATLRRNRLGQTDTGIGGNGAAGFRVDADSGFADLTIGGPDPADGNTVQGNAGDSLAFQLTGSALALVDERNNTLTAPNNLSAAFNIVIEYGPGLTAAQRAAFAAAAQRWESIIIGDLPNVGSIDDVHILASAEAIDGVGGTLGTARPTGLRSGSYLPFQGVMRFDTADLASLQANGQLQDVILHEMAHVLGFGSLWQQLGLIGGSGSSDPRFIGPQATAEFNAEFGMMDAGVPLETTGGHGTANSHWRQSVFGDELMTGFISGAMRPISRTTIAQFSDLGYETDLSQAGP